MKLLLSVIAFSLTYFVFAPDSALADDSKICGRIYIDKDLKFSDNQKTLLCGDGTDAWKSIPINQAQYHLKVFLQQMGYFKAEFSPDYQKHELRTQVGPREEIKKVVYVGYPNAMDPSRRRKLIGQSLKPSQLDDIENWTKGELGNLGYPCSDINLAADPDTGEVRVGIAPGPLQTFKSIEREDIKGLDPRALERYDAFNLGDRYDSSLLRLTSNRIMIDGLMPSTYFITNCTPEGAELTQRLIPGKPRLVVVELGASTEVGPLLRTRWKNTRLGTMASSVTAEISASAKTQSAIIKGEVYFDPELPGLHYAPQLSLVRESETDFTTVTTQLSSPLGYDFDDYGSRIKLSLGPIIENKDKVVGDSGRDSTYVAIDSRIEVMSHEYESFKADPRTGFLTSLELSSREKGFFSDITAQNVEWEYKHLFNYHNYEPPLFVTGVRLRYESLFVNGVSEARDLLTEDFFYRLGGDSNIRGFSRHEIDGPRGIGYLTTLYAGIEGRLVEVLPYGIQPFVFLDAAKAGLETYYFDETTYWSPGVGLRWATAFGVFRATAAHGFVTDLPSGVSDDGLTEWTYFLSYGKEF